MSKILIVDDDPLIRNLLGQILEPFQENGVDILSASNGMTAIDMVRKDPPDIIFLDVMMPKMNGFEVCNTIKNDLTMKGTYIIMLTAKGQELDKQKAKTVGANFYITKPFNIFEIKKKVSEILEINLK